MLITIRPFDFIEDWKFAHSLITNKHLQQWTRPRSITNIPQHLEDLRSEKYTIIYNAKKAGMIRYYKTEISIIIKPQYQRKGLGKAAILFIKTKHKRLKATINRNNQRSINFFEKQGFKFKNMDFIDVELEWQSSTQ